MNASIDFEQLHRRAHAGDPEAQFQLGRVHAARQEWSRARRVWREAADRGHAGALTELALVQLFGIGMPPEPQPAVAMLERAEAAGSGEAACQLALLAWSDHYVRFDAARMGERLRFAALRDFAPALRACALIFARMDGVDAAVSDQCLGRAATLGDRVSQYLFGRRLADRGAAQAPAWLALAARAGITRAGQPTAEAPPVPVDAPTTLPLPGMPCPRPSQIRQHCASPLIETWEDAYTAEECEFMIALGEPHLHRSVTIPDNEPRLVEHEHRTSSDHSFYTFQEDFALRWLQWRMVEPLGVPLANAEHLDLLRYLPGQEYRPHRDYLPPSAPGNSTRPDQPGQRVHTVFSYLADVDAGGETDFPLLDVRIVPKTGRVVHFRNLTADGQPDPRTLHAGMPVIAGVKWLGTLWTRQRRIRDY
jgi:prolyl 4-hydroxylase